MGTPLARTGGAAMRIGPYVLSERLERLDLKKEHESPF